MKMCIHPFRWSLVALLALAFVLAACGEQPTATPLRAERAPAMADAPAPQAQAAAQPSGAVLGTLELHSIDLGFKPTNLMVAQPGRYTVKLTNDGVMAHDVTFLDGTKIATNPKETKSADVEVPAAGMSFFCSIPGHADAGMKGMIMVGSGTASAHNPDDHGGPPPTTDVQADENAPAPQVYDATAPAALAGAEHDIDLVAEEKNMTVAKGFVQAVWTFNGTVPGPVIRVHVGDTVHIHVNFRNKWP
jgi:nitrite reductase (NO-forming)